MAVIQPYQDQVAPQGALNTQASPDQLGAGVGAAMQNVGSAGMALADTLYRNETQADVTNVHVQMAKKRAEWQQKLVDMSNATQPGDETFAPRVMEGVRTDLDALGEQVKTKAGQQLFANMSADMTAMFGQQAIGIQSTLNGNFAKNQYIDLSNSLGTVAAQDHTQVASLLRQARAAIDDPNGRFARVPEPTREAFRRDIDLEIKAAAARGFARRYPNAVLGALPDTMRGVVREVVANPPVPGQVPDLQASDVKPFDPGAISSRVRLINQPSPYDAAFQTAANIYNLDPRELKMRAVVESGLNPGAVSSKNAGGIMQMTPETAARLGVDRMDPQQAIFGAAKLLAEYKAKAGGDMAQVDRMYYGGESGTAWGPNTQQYAANMAALRASAGLGSQVPPEAFAPSDAVRMAGSRDVTKPTTGIDFIDSLPADKFFAVLSEAERYQRAYDTMSERARMDQERLEKKQRDAQMNAYLDRIVNPNDQNGGALSEIEIMGNSVLHYTDKKQLIDYRFARARELAAQAEPRTNPAEVRRLELMIRAADDDPSKTYNADAIMESYKLGRISTPEMRELTKAVNELADSSTNGFRRDANALRDRVFRGLQQSPLIQGLEMASPGTMADIAYRFDRDLERRIDALRKKNENPASLLDPTSPDYVLKYGPNGESPLQKYISQSQAAAKGIGTAIDNVPGLTNAERAALKAVAGQPGGLGDLAAAAAPDAPPAARQTFMERYKQIMTQPAWSVFPDKPLTENIDLLDVARRVFGFGGSSPAAPATPAARPAEPGLAVGTTYNVNGKPMTYLGGPRADRASWREVK